MSSDTSSSNLYLKVLTPEGSVIEGDVNEVTLPGSEGEMGVFPQHAALLTRLIPGRLAYRSPEGDDSVALGRGVAEVQNNQVTVLVNAATLREDIDAAALQAHRKQLEADIEKETHEDRRATLEDELLFTDIQLQVIQEA